MPTTFEQVRERACEVLSDSQLAEMIQALQAEQERRSVLAATLPADCPCPSTRVCERHD